MKKNCLLFVLIAGVTTGVLPASAQDSSTVESSPDDLAATGEKPSTGDTEVDTPTRRPFAGTSFYWINELPVSTLNKDGDITYSPAYSMVFGLTPKWAVTESFHLSTNIWFSTELIDVAKNDHGNIYFGDIPIIGTYVHSIALNDDVNFGTGAGLTVAIPTSPLSRNTFLYTYLGVHAQASFTFSKVLNGLTISWVPNLTKYIHGSDGVMNGAQASDMTGISQTERLTSASYRTLMARGSGIPSWSVTNSFNVSIGIANGLSFGFEYSHWYIRGLAASSVDEPTGSEGISDLLGGERNIIGQQYEVEKGIHSHIFSYELSYVLPEPVNMLTLSLGALTLARSSSSNGVESTPFFNRETVITFALNLDIDATVNAISGSGSK